MNKTIKIEPLPLESLEFDPLNPRLPQSLVRGNNDSEVINWMLSDASIIELMGSIGEKGFFPAEPLLVVKDPKKANKYIVVEGNRRLTAVKLLSHPELATKRSKAVTQVSQEAKIIPKGLPALIFSKRKEILDYLGFKHITGVKAWSALAKAKYLRELQREYKKLSLHDQYKSLAKAIGSRSDYVRELLLGLDIFDKINDSDYFNIQGLDEETLDFGVYYNALKYSNIPHFLGINKNNRNPSSKIDVKNLKEFTKWISEKDRNNTTRLGESRNLSKLNLVIGNEKALKIFRQGRSLDEASMYTEEPHELFRNSIVESLSNLKVADSTMHLVSNPNDSDLDNLKEIASLTADLITIIEGRIYKKK